MEELITLSLGISGESVMLREGVEQPPRELFGSYAEPEQLGILEDALRTFCIQAKIDPGTVGYEEVAELVMALFANGATTPVQLAEALRRHPKL